MSKMRQSSECRNTRQDGDISIGIHCCEYMQYITIVDTDRIVPIVGAESVFDVEDIGISHEIIVDNSPSSIDNLESAIRDIDPCLSPPYIGHITRDKQYIISILIVRSIGQHRIVIGEYHDCWSALGICRYERWSDDIVLDDVDMIGRLVDW